MRARRLGAVLGSLAWVAAVAPVDTNIAILTVREGVDAQVCGGGLLWGGSWLDARKQCGREHSRVRRWARGGGWRAAWMA